MDEPAEKVWYKFMTTLLIPMILFLAAAKFFLRKKEKEFYLAAVSAKTG